MEYVCRDPKATVRGANVLATIEAFALLPHLVEQLLPLHGIERSKLTSTERVRVQSLLDLLRDIAERVGPAKVREVGRRIVEAAFFPPEFGSVEEVLLGLNQIYALNHTGDVGRYLTARLPGGVRVECATPYPRTFERGLVEGIVRNRNLAKGARFTTTYEDGPVAGNEDVTCVLTVHRI